MFRSLKSLRYSTEENLVRDATADSEVEPDPELLEAIAEYTRNEESYRKIYDMIIKRMTDYPKIKHVHKAMNLIDFGLTNFCDQFVEDITLQISVIQRITKYRYYKNGEKDIAGDVRAVAHIILEKLSNEEELQGQRQQAPEHHDVNPAIIEAHEPAPEQEAEDYEDQDAEAPPQENYDNFFDTFQAGGCIIAGRHGSNAGRINGVFTPRDEQVGGMNSFVKEGMADLDDPICLWYYSQIGLWMVSRESCIGTDQAYACCKSTVEHPGDIPDSAPWKVFDKEVGNYVNDSQVSCERN